MLVTADRGRRLLDTHATTMRERRDHAMVAMPTAYAMTP
jgi:hypothetical protein